MDCLFCAIVASEAPAKQVYADDAAIAILDINPWHVGHTLVIPRRHVENLTSDETALVEIAPAITATSRLLLDRLAADGLNMMSSSGAVAGQEIFHMHVHLIPRYNHRPGLTQLMLREPGINLERVHRQILGHG